MGNNINSMNILKKMLTNIQLDSLDLGLENSHLGNNIDNFTILGSIFQEMTKLRNLTL